MVGDELLHPGDGLGRARPARWQESAVCEEGVGGVTGESGQCRSRADTWTGSCGLKLTGPTSEWQDQGWAVAVGIF